MKHVQSFHPALLAVMLATPVLAQSPAPDAAPPFNFDPPPARSANRVGINYRMGFNAPVSFKNLGGFPALGGVNRLTPDGDPYNYNNGYVYPDGRVNLTEFTRYWGYDSASQVSGDGTMAMQRSSSPATASSNDHYDTPMSGFEVTYNRELINKGTWKGGLEGAFGYTYVSVHDAGTESAAVNRVTDSYPIPGGVNAVPAPGYRGSKFVDGPVLGSSPSSSRTDTLHDGSITGSRDFSADLFNFRVGPYLEIPLSKAVSFTLSGGFAFMYVNSEFSYNETVTIPGIGSVQHHASGSGNGWLTGGYVAGTFSVALSDAWALTAGAQFEDLGKYTQTLSGKEAVLDLSSAIFVTVGLTYSF